MEGTTSGEQIALWGQVVNMEHVGDVDSCSVVTENGVTIKVKPNHDNPGKCKTFYNPVMRICREFVLVALGAFLKAQDKPVKSLDAFAASGIAGMQWKKHNGQKVTVTLNELDPEVCSTIKGNCQLNNFTCGTLEEAEQNAEVLEVSNMDANVILHQRQHHFIHLDPYGSTVQFLDATFRNVYHKGMVVVTATDVASLYGKTSNVTLRNYGAFSVKTDYTKELAARILLAAVARAASRCNKGIKVVYTVAVEHFVQVGVLINRGATHADASIATVRRVLHCQMCEEWALYPDTHTPVEKPYDLLACDCRSLNPGKTAMELGPLWSGCLYDTHFLHQMAEEDSLLSLSTRLQNLLELMYCESLCLNCAPDLTLFKLMQKSNQRTSAVRDESLHRDHQVTSETVSDKNQDIINSDYSDHEPQTKKLKMTKSSSETGETMPMFYYNVHRRKFRNVNQLPRMVKLVSLLHGAGFRASRTHFEPQAVRTNAKLKELKKVIEEKCALT